LFFSVVLLATAAAGAAGASEPGEATSRQARERQARDEAPFEEETSPVHWGLVLDFRFARSSSTLGWLDGGLGKSRYGGSEEGAGKSRARLAQASVVLETRLGRHLSTHLHFNVDAEPERGGAAERIDLIQAWARWATTSSLQLRARLGLFFPPISLEHPGEAWTTFYTITPSAINGWVGEEIRALGAEAELASVSATERVSVTGAAFGWNEPAASLLAFRGWALHDRQTGFADRVPLAPLPSIGAGGIFMDQAPRAEPLRRVGGRIGYYGGLRWDRFGAAELGALYYDNRAHPADFDGEQYGWATDFVSLGGRGQLGTAVEVLTQFLQGTTRMGRQEPGQPQVRMDFQAAYGMVSGLRGRSRLSLRFDWFRTEDRDAFRLLDNNDEHGSAWTFAYSFRFAEKHRLALELLRISSDRTARAMIGRPAGAVEWLFQLSYRWQVF
jgi:hypothetical protein